MINKTYLGTSKPKAYYFGNLEATKIYKGTELIYQKADEYVFINEGEESLIFTSHSMDNQVPLIVSTKNGLDQPFDFTNAPYWVNVEMMNVENDDGTIYTYAEILPSINTTSRMRSALVTFTQRESGTMLTIGVIQEGYVVSTTFHPTNLQFDQRGGTKYVTYTPQNAVVQEKTGTSHPWLTITVSNGTITLKTVANLKKNPRVAYLQWQVNDDLYSLSVSQDPYIMS